MNQFKLNIIVAVCFGLPSSVFAEVFDLGGLYTYHYHDGRYADWGDYARHGARIALKEVNESGMLGEDRLRMKPENTIDYHCWPDGVAAMAETLIKKDVLAITGADCSGPAVEIADIAAQYQIPVISNGANASMLSSTERFPWFVRVVTPSEAYEGHLIDVAKYFGVTQIGYLHTTDAWGLGARKVIRAYAARHKIEIAKEFGFARDTDYATVEQYVKEIQAAGIKHVVMTGPTPDTVSVFRALHNLGMNQPGNSFYAAEMISADEVPEAVQGSLGYFAPMTLMVDSEIVRRFQYNLSQRIGAKIDPNSKAFFYGALSYDHILAVANAIKSIKDAGKPVSRVNLMHYLRQVNFQGATGNVSVIPGTNDRDNMPVQIFNSHGYKADGKTVKFVSVGSVDTDTGELEIDVSKILWPGGTKTPPNQ